MVIVVSPSPENVRGGRRITTGLFATTMLAALFLLAVYSSGADAKEQIMASGFQGGHRRELAEPFSGNFSSRKILQEGEDGLVSSPSSSTEGTGEGCSIDDIYVHQAATPPLPNGIPTYTVNVLNLCTAGCSMAGIHLSCGWFSSARLVNPRIFRRLGQNDCLLNDGQPLSPGSSISFEYANSYRYPLAVSSGSCAS